MINTSAVERARAWLASASTMIVVPGYGLARSRGHRALAELVDGLSRCEVTYVVHPVAGRLPGQLNLLLDEAGVPHDQLRDPAVPPVADVALVVGADDVVNPAAGTDPASPLHGLEIVDLGQVERIIMINLPDRAGHAGVPNTLRDPSADPRVLVLEGDARTVLRALGGAEMLADQSGVVRHAGRTRQ